MKARLLILLFLACATFICAQEPSIQNQDFKGVKSVKLFTSETDSSGKVLSKKIISEEHFYDSTGKETRVLYYDKGAHYRSDDYLFDSLGRKTMYILWTKKEGNKKYIYTYETKGDYTIVYESLNKEIIHTESSYWDTSKKHFIERTWNGESTMDTPAYQREFNKDGKMVMTSSYNGFTEFRYDSLGTLTYMLIRAFENGECAGYSPFPYTTVYSGGHLVEYNSKWDSTWFAYNDRGYISSEKVRSNHSNRIVVTEAEYVYY